MAESTYSLDKEALDERIGHFLGHGATTGNFSTGQQANIDRVREEGLMNFYNAYDWTFLTPSTTLSITADDYDIDLPDNFGWILGSFHYSTDDAYNTLKMTSVGRIMELRAGSDATGIPREFAISVKSNDASTTARYEVLLYPTPGSAYTLNYRYNVIRDAITTTQYPLGGALFRTVMTEACLAAAEAQLDDTIGLHENRYRMMLQDSIRIDKMNKPKFFGKNLDYSDEPVDLYSRNRDCTYNGSLPS